jgi:Tol biopolymer transport system component
VSESGTLLYLSNAVAASQRALVWVGRDGREQPVDSAWHGTFTDPVISPDGTRIAVASGVNVADIVGASTMTGAGAGDIWLKRLDNGVVSKLTVEGGDNRFPAWAWDGKSVFYAGGTNRQSIVERRADGSAPPATLVKTDEYIGAIAMTPDRQWLVYQSGTGAANSHLFVRHAGDTVSTPLFPGKSVNRSPALSPDGKWLAYVANESGASEVFVVPFPNVGSAKWQVSRQGGTDPIWSTRGDEVIYRAGDRYLVSVPVSTRPTFSPGTPKRLFSSESYLPHIAIEHDDLRFLMVRPLGGASRERLTVFENWTAVMGRK